MQTSAPVCKDWPFSTHRYFTAERNFLVAAAVNCYVWLMLPTRQGSFRLFRLFGIDVYLHWSWFLAVCLIYQINSSQSQFHAAIWNLLECLGLFSLVLMHEFGHALACKQVGGQANLIVLWPLGGVAYVSPPQRPGAMLWSIAAGPLVNVVLFPVLFGLSLFGMYAGWMHIMPDLMTFVETLFTINFLLLKFNLLPIFPLDGGQILRSLLWFPFGRARSLMISSIIGFVGLAGLVLYAISKRSSWLGAICVFILLNCWRGFSQARELMKLDKLPHHDGFACPSCHASPIAGNFWGCGHCRTAFDTFATHAVCPQCGAQFQTTACLECGQLHPMSEWITPKGSVPPRL